MRLTKKLLGELTILLIFVSLSGCTSNISAMNNSDSIKEIKIGVTLYKKDNTLISAIAKNIQDTAKEKEGEGKYKIKVEVVDANGILNNQNNQVDNFISKKYDVICVNLVDRTNASMIIDKAKKAGIPIIFFNREPVEKDMERWNKLYYVGTQTEKSGEMQANIIINSYIRDKRKVDRNGDGKIQYVMLEGEQGHQDSLIRTAYCIKTITDNGIQLERLADDTGNWEYIQGVTKMTQWVKTFGNKIEVVFSNDDDMALGAIHALNNLNIIENRPLIVGANGMPDALKAVKNGSMLGTVLNDYKKQGDAVFNLAYTLATCGDVNSIEGLEKGKYIKTPHTQITSENVDLYLENNK